MSTIFTFHLIEGLLTACRRRHQHRHIVIIDIDVVIIIDIVAVIIIITVVDDLQMHHKTTLFVLESLDAVQQG